jgi:hypothetical protein
LPRDVNDPENAFVLEPGEAVNNWTKVERILSRCDGRSDIKAELGDLARADSVANRGR